MMNKDFLKEVFTEEKAFLKLNEVKWRNVPLYDELSVVRLWPMMKQDKSFMRYFPAKLPKGRVPDREYFFNILNTFYESYLDQIIQHAHNQRMAVQTEAKARETIEISDDWWEALNAVPFVSCK